MPHLDIASHPQVETQVDSGTVQMDVESHDLSSPAPSPGSEAPWWAAPAPWRTLDVVDDLWDLSVLHRGTVVIPW